MARRRAANKGKKCTRFKMVTIKHGRGRGKKVKRCAKFGR